MSERPTHPSSVLIDPLCDARARTLSLLSGLNEEQLIGPKLDTVNPLLWEVGHVGYFHEFWILRHLDKRDPLIHGVDELYDSIDIPHIARWDLPLPPLPDVLHYLDTVHQAEVERLSQRAPDARDEYFYRLAVFHEDMHGEAFIHTRQTLAYPAPDLGHAPNPLSAEDMLAGPLPGDVQAPGGTYWMGSHPDEPFVFDNEKWAHPILVAPFRIARAPVTNEEYARFVIEDGYRRPEFWSPEGWAWRSAQGLERPRYWREDGNGFEVRHFDLWVPLAPHQPVMNISWHEAKAWCRWAGRRLPTEVEWEYAASCDPALTGRACKRRYPWGADMPQPEQANLDGLHMAPLDVAALPDGDSPIGCRQMIGNVWEWTDTIFQPYPGFTPDPYEQYSQPLFGNTRVLRGGCWATRGRVIHNAWRNYYAPERNDVYAGFRTCAL